MQTRTATRKASAATKPAWPPLPDCANPLWSLAWYFRKLAEYEAVKQHHRSVTARSKASTPLTHALVGAWCDLEEAVNGAADRATKEGLLPFAWVGSTAVNKIEARA